MKKLIVALAAIIIALSISAWAGDKEYQECLRMQEQGYAIGCNPPMVNIERVGNKFTPTEDITKKPVTYKIQLTIKYNAVSETKAAEIARKALVRHGEGACQFEVKIKKNGDNQGLTITGTSPTWLNGTLITSR